MKPATLASGLLLTLALSASAPAENPKVVQEVRRSGGQTEIVIKDYRPAAPRPARPAGPAFREYDLVAPAAAPRPAAPPPALPAPGYSQQFSPGPNTGMANNGFFTPGGASILSTGPIWGGGFWGGGWGGYGFSGGYAGYGRCGVPYQGYAGYGYGYQPYYLNGNLINTPQQRYNPPPGLHPYSLTNPAPQSFYPGGYGPGYGFYGPAGGCRPGFTGGFRGGFPGGGGRCGR